MITHTKGLFFEKKENSQIETDIESQMAPPKTKESPVEILAKDMIQTLEINKKSKKMIHAPSLCVYKLQKVSDSADEDRQQIYTILNIWKKLNYLLPDNIIPFENVYYVSSHNSVQICLNHTRQYPLKVLL